MNHPLARLATWLRAARHPDADVLPTTLPVPSGGVVRVGRPLPSYQRWEHSTYIRSAVLPVQCRQCRLLNLDIASRSFLHCAVNPLGPETDPCRDFQPTLDED